MGTGHLHPLILGAAREALRDVLADPVASAYMPREAAYRMLVRASFDEAYAIKAIDAAIGELREAGEWK